MKLSRKTSQHMRICRYLSSQRNAKARSPSGWIADDRVDDSRFTSRICENSLRVAMASRPKKWQKRRILRLGHDLLDGDREIANSWREGDFRIVDVLPLSSRELSQTTADASAASPRAADWL
jgi:hypothetical protein